MTSWHLKRRKLSPENDNRTRIAPDPLSQAQYTEDATNGTHFDDNEQRVLAHRDLDRHADLDSQDSESSTDDMKEEPRGEKVAEWPASEPQVMKIPPQPFGKSMKTTTDAKASHAAGAKAAFGSNVFRFQGEELLKQIRSDHTPRKTSLDSTLRTLKTIIEQAPSIEPMPVNLANVSRSILC